MRRRGILRLIAVCLFFSLWASASSSQRPKSYEGFTFSPDGSYLLAAYFDGASSFIYKVPLDTGKATRLTGAKEGFEGVPSFSADGRRIAYSFSPGHEANSRLIIANTDGSDAHALASSGTNDFGALLSSDNKTVIFKRSGYYGNYSPIARPAQHEWNFFMADLDGNNVRRLTHESLYMVSPASLSPDGKTLLFVDSFEKIVLYSVKEASEPKAVLQPKLNGKKAGAYGEAVFSSDGKNIFFIAAFNGGKYNYDIYRFDLGTENVEPLTADKGQASRLQVSRDGQRAVFVHDDYSDHTTVFLLDLRTHKLMPLTITGIP